jgi:agmatine/peptidylarginine deiminase
VEVAGAIARFQPVILRAPSRLVPEAKEQLGPSVWVEEMGLDDGWIRANGPTFVRSDRSELAVDEFGFNGWGGRFTPFAQDARVPEEIARRRSLPTSRAPIVAEGGAITVDGDRTMNRRGVASTWPALHENRVDRIHRALDGRWGRRRVAGPPFPDINPVAMGPADRGTRWNVGVLASSRAGGERCGCSA